jgi:NADH-quinone oxidoreductase subunit A
MMATFTSLVGYLVLFTVVAIVFLFSTLLIGKLVRPRLPNPEKEAVYECGEPTIGSSWIQFDLRFYVVALLFVVFDVEVAFFFPWALVFGQAARLADPSPPPAAAVAGDPLGELGFTAPGGAISQDDRTAARTLVRVAFADLLVFFGVVLVGFAYVWKRGDLEWVRATSLAETQPAPAWTEPASPPDASVPEPAGH